MKHYYTDSSFAEWIAGFGALLLLAGAGYGAVLAGRAVAAWFGIS